MHRDSLGRVLPVLPRGDPDTPRAQPRFRVGGDLDQHGISTLSDFLRLTNMNFTLFNRIIIRWLRLRPQ